MLKGGLIDESTDSNWEMSTILKPEYKVLVSPINEIYSNITFSHCVCDYISNNFKGTFPVVYDPVLYVKITQPMIYKVSEEGEGWVSNGVPSLNKYYRDW